MCPRCSSSRSERGFTLIEATISMTLLLIVLIVSMAFLISMRTFSQRQEMSTAPRQTARRATDYLTYYARGAIDMNQPGDFPNILPVWYQNAAGTAVQVSYNNLTGTETGNATAAWANTDLSPLPTGYPTTSTKFGDPGTDLINFAIPNNSGVLSPYTGGSVLASGDVAFSLGCGTDAQNLALFKQMTGCCDASGNSGLVNIMDGQGRWGYFAITSYASSTGCPSGGTIHIVTSSGSTLGISPPGGITMTPPYTFAVGSGYSAFRVKDQSLQQKNGIFLPGTPEPTDPLYAWNTILSNVEDLQVAYIYNDGTVTNGTGSTMATTGGVPTQVGSAFATTDIRNVVALRISVVARSGRIGFTQQVTKNLLLRPAIEDHAAGPSDRFYHYRMTSTIILRNRALGN